MTISREVKVGIFVLIGIIVSGVVVFLIGDERRMFARHVSYATSFRDVQGLKVGAPVRMNGIDVGTVMGVGHADDVADPRIHVRLSVVRAEAQRLRQDALARIVNKGLLGDKMLEFVPGSGGPAPPDTRTIAGEDPTDLSNVMGRVGSMAEKTDSILGNLDAVSKVLSDQKMQQDLQSSVHSVTVILKNVAEGGGYAHKLLADPAEAERLSRAVAGFERTSTELASAAIEMRQLAVRLNRGPGFAHDLVYSDDGTKAVGQLGSAAGELALTLKAVRENKGVAHGLVFGDDEQRQIVANLSATSKDLRDIVAGAKAGKGTLGALLVDPSVYEDMKMVLGNVQRNEVLRALVRYSIRQDEKKPSVEVRDPGPPPPAPPGTRAP
jgi:phospholipid/cholesterol/gamma-HCH transport system substrate-binding protein